MWKKILLGILAFIAIVLILAFILTRGLAGVASMQLTALRNGDIKAAYSYTSSEFKANTSEAEFAQFVDIYSVLRNNKSASWSSRERKDNTGTLKGTLTAQDGMVVPVEYHFVKENHEWKIIGILVRQSQAVMPQSQDSKAQETKTISDKDAPKDLNQAAGEIHQVFVSDEPGRSGSIEENKSVIDAKSPKVYVSVYIAHAKPGLKVDATFVRLENGAKIGPSSAVVSKGGDIIRDFSFTNTEKTWPAGKYRINIITSNSQGASVDFEIK